MKTIIQPPSKLKLFPLTTKWKQDVIDYNEHPQYKFSNNKNFLYKIINTFRFLKFFIINLLKRLIKYELIPLNIRSGNSTKSRLTFITLSLKNALGIKSKKFKSLEKNQVASSMDKNGVSVVQMSNQDYKLLKDSSEKYFNNLEEKRNKSKTGNRDFEDSRSYTSRETAPELFKVIEQIFNKNGVMQGASHHLGRDVSLIDVNPQINDKTDNFWSEIFTDSNKLDFPSTAYFHRDASGGDLKAIIYITDVSENNGPFTFSIGSHNMSISRLDDWICETNDSSGFSSTNKNQREMFMTLPRYLKQKGSFGNDLLNKSEFSNHILDSSWQITSKKGSIVLFDTKGAHRGGMVKNGQRRVITCVLG